MNERFFVRNDLFIRSIAESASNESLNLVRRVSQSGLDNTKYLLSLVDG